MKKKDPINKKDLKPGTPEYVAFNSSLLASNEKGTPRKNWLRTDLKLPGDGLPPTTRPHKSYQYSEYHRLNLNNPFQIKKTHDWLENFGKRMLEWAESGPDKNVFKEFLALERVSKSTLLKWEKKYPRLRQYHALTMQRLGVNREKVALEKDVSVFKHMQHYYDEDWAAANEYHAKLKEREKVTNEGTKYIILPEVPKTDVPKKKDK